MKELSKKQATALLAFLDGFDRLTGAWPTIEGVMREEWGLDDPEAALEDARSALE